MCLETFLKKRKVERKCLTIPLLQSSLYMLSVLRCAMMVLLMV
uniref:Uncharacterized protein n=1 Tax=Anguilla anguilla TaxID=7936 RepID=A0A0E9W7H9_ANGAN